MKLNTLQLAASAIVFSGYSIAAPVTLMDYEQASSAYEDAYINGLFDLQSGNQNQASYNLDLSLDYEKVYSSKDHNLKLELEGDTSRKRGPNDGDKTISTYQGTGSVTSDHYLQANSNGMFWYGKGEAGVQKAMEDPFTKITVGLGYGRVVNATPMAKAIRLIDALQEHDILLSKPSAEEYKRVADVISRENEYRSKHGVAVVVQ